VIGRPKGVYVRNKALTEACRLLPCQHCHRDEFGRICAAHSNWGIHGKGGHIKASDDMVAALCDTCHVPLLDQGSKLSKSERQQLWWLAHVRTVLELIRRGLWPKAVAVPDIQTYPF
jgi:hypothetical protein